MNKCEIVYDLLPNYINELTSPSTSKFIEEHLNTCTNCKETFEMITKEIQGEVFKEEEVNFLGKIRKSYLVKLGVSLALVITLLIGLVYLANEIIVPIPSEKVTLKEVYKLDDGRIYYKIEVEGADEFTYLSEGIGLAFPKELDKNAEESYYVVSLKRTLLNSIFHNSKKAKRTEWRIIDLKQGAREGYSIETTGIDISRNIKKVYYEGKDETDRLIIWEEGMVIPPAPEGIGELLK